METPEHKETLMPAVNGHGDPAQDQEVTASLEADPAGEDSPPEAQKGAEEGAHEAEFPALDSPPEAQDQPAEADKVDENPPAAEESPTPERVEPPAPDPRDSRIIELERALDDARRDVELLKADQAKVEKSLAEQLANAGNRYKTLALASSPEIPAELVQGQTVEEVEASMAQARAVVQKVREQLAAQAPPVGGGAPVRQEPDPEQLSALDKIRYAISRRK